MIAVVILLRVLARIESLRLEKKKKKITEKEGELATMSLKFAHLHRKSRCEMLIGGDCVSNDVITLRTFFSMFVYIRASR